MARRRRSVDASNPTDLIIEHLIAQEEQARASNQAGSAMIQIENKKTSIDPVNGEIIFDFPRKQICVFFDGKWWCTGAMIWDKFRRVSSNPAVISSVPCYYGGHYVDNDNLSLFRFVHLYDQATTPTAGDTPAITIGVPPDSGANQEYSGGVFFENGLAMAFSSGRTGGVTGVSTGEMVATILYNEDV